VSPARDVDRAAVYEAELAAFDGTDLERVRPLRALDELVGRVVGGPWWPGPGVRVAGTRRDAGSSCCRDVGGVDQGGSPSPIEIRLAPPQMTVATVAHELAHALAGPAHGHDATFRRAYLDVIVAVTNLDTTDRRRLLHHDQLLTALDAAGLAVGERRWPAPAELRGGGAIAL
jgi:hypothetical protein